MEVQHSWRGSYDFAYASVSRDAGGKPALLKFTHQEVKPANGGFLEDDVYLFATQLPVAGYRSSFADDCIIRSFGVNVSIGLFGRPALSDAPATYSLALGAPPLISPGFQLMGSDIEKILTGDSGAGIDDMQASSSSFGFDVSLGWNGLVRVPVGNPSGSVMSKYPHPELHMEMIEGDDVYGYSFSTPTGWQAEYVMAQDGTMNLYRAKDKTHILGLRSDGMTMFWVETYGLPDPNLVFPFVPQPNMDVWAAPYTNDPTKLAATAKKIASIPNGQWAELAAAFNGIYAFSSDSKTLSVVRLSDGAVQQISAGPGRAFDGVAYVSLSEVWVTLMGYDDDAGTRARGGVALARYALQPW